MQTDGNSDLSVMKPIFFVSDIHAGIHQDQNDRSKLEDFKVLLERSLAEASELVLLGDIFDFWYEWKHVIPAHLFPWLDALKGATTRGLTISIFPGNHDFRLGRFLEQEIGLQICPELQRRDINGRSFLLHHGDGLDPKEYSYRLLKRLIRNPISYGLFNLLHPDLGMRLAHSASKSEKHMTWSPEEIAGSLQRGLPLLLQQKTDWVVLGHVHVPSRSSFGTTYGTTYGTTEVATLPAFTMPARGYAVFDGESLDFVFQEPEKSGSEIFQLEKLGDNNV